MRLDDMRESDNVDDRRGEGGGGGFGPRMMMGGGGLGLVAVVVISLLFGVDPSQLLGGGGPVPVQREAQQQGSGCTDADCAFARRVIGSAEDVWTPLLERKGVRFTPATLTVYDQVTPTACGTGQSNAGPFYCPGDSNIYLDLSFYNELSQRFGAAGDFARAYVIAHELGHHVQKLLGIEGKVHRLQQQDPADANPLSVRLELQADCFAGVWGHSTEQRNIVDQGDVAAALRAASAVGDDRLQRQASGRVNPETFTHGSSREREHWFQTGLDEGKVSACSTFQSKGL